MVDHRRRSHGSRLRETGERTLAKISLDSMHQSCFLAWHGQSEYGGGYSGGYVLGFSLHLSQKWHRWKLHAHWMTFWWWRCSSTKDHTPPLRMVRWNQKILLPFDLKNTIVLGQRWALSMFTSCIVVQSASDRRHSVQSYFGALPNILYLELWAASRSECNLWERKGLLCTPLL